MPLLRVIIVDSDAVERMHLRRRISERLPDVVVHEATGAASCAERLGPLSDRRVMVLAVVRSTSDETDLLQRLRDQEETASSVLFVLSDSDETLAVADAYERRVAGYMLIDAEGAYVADVVDLVGLYARAMTLRRSS